MEDINDVFLSYAREDHAIAKQLADPLKAAGFRVWFDQDRLQDGCDWYKEIHAGCDSSLVFIAILTPAWFASDWTKFETYSGRYVIPLLVDAAAERLIEEAPPLSHHQALTFDLRDARPANWEAFFTRVRELRDEAIANRERFGKRDGRIRAGIDHVKEFVGRQTDLVTIHRALFKPRSTGVTRGEVIALTANGGYGKTTIARAYIEYFWRCYDQIFWINAAIPLETPPNRLQAETDMRLVTAYSSLLFPALLPGKKEKDPAVRVSKVIEELQRSDGGTPRRLLVIDDVDSEAALAGFLPASGSTHVLITSRFSSWERAVALPVRLLEQRPSRELLFGASRIAPEKYPDFAEKIIRDADELAKSLQYLPLALKLAGAYIAETYPNKDGFAQYAEAYRQIPFGKNSGAEGVLEKEGSLLTKVLMDENGRNRDYPVSVARVWVLSISRLSPIARALLGFVSFLAPESIPESLFVKQPLAALRYMKLEKPVEFSDAATLKAIHDALGEFARYSISERFNEQLVFGQRCRNLIRIHKLLQEVCRHAATDEDRLRAVHWFMTVASGFSDEDLRSVEGLEQWLPFFPHLVYFATSQQRAYLRGDAPMILGDQLYLVQSAFDRLSEYPTRKTAIMAAIACYDEQLKMTPAFAWPKRSINPLAILGRIVKGLFEPYNVRQKNIHNATMNVALHAKRGNAYMVLGYFFDDFSKAADAEIALMAAEKDYDAALQILPDSPSVLANKSMVLARIGNIRSQLSDFKGSDAILSSAMDNAERAGQNSSRSFETWCAKGDSLAKQAENFKMLRDYPATREMLLAAIENYDKAIELAPDKAGGHTGKGLALREFGELQMYLSELSDAQATLNDAIECSDKAIDCDPREPGWHTNKGNALWTLGRVQEAVSEFEDALETLGKAVESFDDALKLAPKFNRAHGNKALALHAQASIHHGQSKRDKAHRSLDESLKSFDLALANRGQDAQIHCNKGIALALRGLLFLDEKDFEAARSAYVTSIKGFVDALLIAPQQLNALLAGANACYELMFCESQLELYAEALGSLEKGRVWARSYERIAQDGSQGSRLITMFDDAEAWIRRRMAS